MAEFPLEPQWLEMLNEANERAQSAALERDKIHRQHKRATFIYSKCDKVAKAKLEIPHNSNSSLSISCSEGLNTKPCRLGNTRP